jgi:GDP-L-fucose synthase
VINKESKIYIAGHKGMVGSACWRLLEKEGYSNLIGITSSDLDLRNQASVEEFFKTEKPKVVIDAAARVGGIWANNEYQYEFLMDNLLIQNNLIKSAHEYAVKKFIFLGSSCIYPKLAPQPLKEEYLLTAPLEESNQWYAIAKIAGVKLVESIRNQFNKDFVSLMPTNLYGPGDNYDLKTSHVLPALIRKFHEAKERDDKQVIIWGTGTPLREFLHVSDLAEAILFAVKNTLNHHLYNIGSGKELTIFELAETIKKVVGYQGDIKWNPSMPNGTPRKLMNSSRFLKLGWTPSTSLEMGIEATYNWYVKTFKML